MVSIKMEKSLTAGEVYSIARPSIVAKIKDIAEPSKSISNIDKTEGKLLSDKVRIDANLYNIYLRDKKEIDAQIEEVEDRKDLANKLSNMIADIINYTDDKAYDPEDIKKDILESSDNDLIKMGNKIKSIKDNLEPSIIKNKEKLYKYQTYLKVFDIIINNVLSELIEDDINLKTPTRNIIKITRNFIYKEPFYKYLTPYFDKIFNVKDIPEHKTLEDVYFGFDDIKKNINDVINTSNNVIEYEEKLIRYSIISYQSISNVLGKTIPLIERLNKSKNKLTKLEKDFKEKSEDLKKKLKKSETVHTRINKSNKVLKEHFKHDIKNKVILFEDISNYSSVGELMGDNDMLLIIYRNKETYGHWVGLFRNSYGLNYFNSYGTYIDKAIDNIPDEFKNISGQNFPHLLRLLFEGYESVFWNDKPLQLRAEGVNTCGRWVGYCMQRCAGEDGEQLEDFIDSFYKLKDKKNKYLLDDTITRLTEPYLKSPPAKVTWINNN